MVSGKFVQNCAIKNALQELQSVKESRLYQRSVKGSIRLTYLRYIKGRGLIDEVVQPVGEEQIRMTAP